MARQTPRHPPPHAPPFCLGGGACWYCICYTYSVNTNFARIFGYSNVLVALEVLVGNRLVEEDTGGHNHLAGSHRTPRTCQHEVNTELKTNAHSEAVEGALGCSILGSTY